MKKFKTFAFIAAAVLCCGSAAAGEAKVIALNGEAFVVNPDGIMRAKPGMVCAAGDMIMTREGCQLEVLFNGQIGCRFLPNTSAVVASVDAEKSKLIVAEGNVIFNIKSLSGGTFMMDTPTAVAAVRGTQFWGRVAGGENETMTSFAVKEGSVSVLSKASGQSTTLNAGQAVDLGSGTTSVQVRPAAPAEMEAMKIADDMASRM